MACNCDALKAEVMSQRELLSEWFQILRVEIRDAKTELVQLIKESTFNVNASDQQLICQQSSLGAPLSASAFLGSRNNPLQYDNVVSGSNPVSLSVEPTPDPEMEPTPDPTFKNELISPKIEPKIEELLVEFSLAQNKHSDVTLGAQAEANSELNRVCNVKSAGFSSLVKNKSFETGSVPKPFACDQSNYRYTTNWHLMRHQRSHTDEKPFSCRLCQKRFKQKHHLTVHMTVHTAEKPLKRDLCDFRCKSNGRTQAANLFRHKRLHTGEKRLFPCDQCDFTAGYNSDLKIHQRVHTGEKPFACDQCHYRASQKINLQNHTRRHTGETPFQCDLCGFRAVSRSAVLMHRKRKHKPQFLEVLERITSP